MSAKKQNKKIPIIVVFSLIAIVVFITMLTNLLRPEAYSDRQAKLAEVYSAKEGSAAIIVNGRKTDVRATIKNHHAYLPLRKVVDEINSCFYYSNIDKTLLYTSALEVVTAGRKDTYDESPIFYDSEEGKADSKTALYDRIYVLLDYVACYTNIQVDYYTAPDRVFIRSRYGSKTEYALVSGGLAMRREPSISADIITYLQDGEKLWLAEQVDESWYLAYIGGTHGHAGYVNVEDLKEKETVTDKGDYITPNYTRIALDEPIRLAWHQMLYDSGLESIEGYLPDAEGANIIVPTWFSVEGSDGTISSRAKQEYVNYVQNHGKHVWALVENFNTTNKLDYDRLLGKASSRAQMIETLISESQRCGIEGINVDFEGLPSSAGTSYVQFLRELSVECRKAGIILSVDNYVPSAWTSFYDRGEQGKFVDYFVIMAYDEHYAGTEAGSTASLPFVKKGIDDTIAEGVPADKIIVGVPFFARVWSGEGSKLTSETIGMEDMKELRDQHESGTSWDDEAAQYYTEYKSEDKLKRVWSESTESLEAKLELISHYGVCGVAGWKLGMEDPEAWTIIKNYFPTPEA